MDDARASETPTRTRPLKQWHLARRAAKRKRRYHAARQRGAFRCGGSTQPQDLVVRTCDGRDRARMGRNGSLGRRRRPDRLLRDGTRRGTRSRLAARGRTGRPPPRARRRRGRRAHPRHAPRPRYRCSRRSGRAAGVAGDRLPCARGVEGSRVSVRSWRRLHAPARCLPGTAARQRSLVRRWARGFLRRGEFADRRGGRHGARDFSPVMARPDCSSETARCSTRRLSCCSGSARPSFTPTWPARTPASTQPSGRLVGSGRGAVVGADGGELAGRHPHRGGAARAPPVVKYEHSRTLQRLGFSSERTGGKTRRVRRFRGGARWCAHGRCGSSTGELRASSASSRGGRAA
jgi:hypothetical protein